MGYFPTNYFPLGGTSTTVIVTPGSGGGPPIFNPEPVRVSEATQVVRSMIAITQRGGDPLLYLTRGDLSKVQVLNLSGRNTAISGGRYDMRPISGEGESAAVLIEVRGKCAPGTFCTATLKLYLDTAGDFENRGRALTFPLRGPYNRAQGILWYQEFPIAASVGRELLPSLQDILGIDVEIAEARLERVERS